MEWTHGCLKANRQSLCLRPGNLFFTENIISECLYFIVKEHKPSPTSGSGQKSVTVTRSSLLVMSGLLLPRTRNAVPFRRPTSDPEGSYTVTSRTLPTLQGGEGGPDTAAASPSEGRWAGTVPGPRVSPHLRPLQARPCDSPPHLSPPLPLSSTSSDLRVPKPASATALHTNTHTPELHVCLTVTKRYNHQRKFKFQKYLPRADFLDGTATDAGELHEAPSIPSHQCGGPRLRCSSHGRANSVVFGKRHLRVTCSDTPSALTRQEGDPPHHRPPE